MKRDFSYITRGKIMNELSQEGLTDVHMSQFLRFERTGIIPKASRTGGNWRVYSRKEAEDIKRAIWNYYGGKKTFERAIL